MSSIHLQATTDGKGNLTLRDLAVGVPNAQVNVNVEVTVSPKTPPRRLSELIDQASVSVDHSFLKEHPASPLRDPWEGK